MAESLRTSIPIVCLVFFITASSYAQDLNMLFSKAMTAYQKDNYGEALRIFEKMDSIRSNHPVINKNLARLYARTGNMMKAEIYLKKIAITDADTALFLVEDFQSFKQTNRYRPLRVLFEEMQQPVHTSTLAFELDDKTLHPESAAYDTQTKQFFVGSIRNRKIVVHSENGTTNFTEEAQDGLWSVLGMKVDAKRRLLWVCTAALPQMDGYEDQLAGETGIYKYNIDTGALVEKYILDEDGNHSFSDLVIAQDGSVYITDSGTAAVYSIKNDRLVKLKELPEFRSLQGITLNTNDLKLYFADYIAGIFSLEINSIDKEPRPVITSELVSTKGIDGLYWYNNGLIAIQNGVKPMRVTHLKLSTDTDEVIAHSYLEKATSILDEPTLGTIVGNQFYYVANSPWGYYTEDQKLKTSEIKKSAIYKISLNKVK